MSIQDLSFDFTSLGRAYAQGLDPVALIGEVCRRITLADDPGIFIHLVDRTDALTAARRIGPYSADKPLWGLPFAVKDNIDVAGIETTAGCPEFAYVPEATAPAVARLLDAGAILIGKTNLDQFATGLVGVRSPYPVPRNAFDPEIVPGGSSSGSAVAVARGILSFALGTDTAGSGRIPAGLNNIVGLKPSLGAVSTRGVVPACRTLDCVSVFAPTVPDAYAVFATMAGYDAEDAFSRHIAVGPLGAPAPGLRVGVPDAKSLTFAGDALSEAAFRKSLDDLAATGLRIEEIDLMPFLETAKLLYSGPWVAERYQAIRTFIETGADRLLPVIREVIGGAAALGAADAFAGMYRLADLKRATEPVWSRIDALMVPTYPRPRSTADLAADPIGPNSELGTYTNFVNLLNLAALAVPGRFRADGFPSGVTLIGPAGSDALLASIGERMHRASGVPLGATGRAQPPQADRLNKVQPGEIELVVVGAHLSGMALNHELTRSGGRFLRAVSTAPDYRLFALAGGPPKRPGLLRVGAGTGHAIETEVWALSPAAFGSFVANIPSPLGIGTLCLADGTTPKGFLVEPEGLAGAEDISRFGGWREFVGGLVPA